MGSILNLKPKVLCSSCNQPLKEKKVFGDTVLGGGQCEPCKKVFCDKCMKKKVNKMGLTEMYCPKCGGDLRRVTA